jgi:uncharacterized caspase-like protein
MTEILWNVDSWDWGDPIPSSIAERVVDRLEASKKGILLFHDIHKQTVAALPFIMEELSRRGYRWSDLQGAAAEVPVAAPDLEVERTDEADPVEATVEPDARHYRDSWAVVIGINDYRHWPRLAYAVADADAISKLLTERFGFKPSNVFTLLDQEATRDNIVSALGGTLADPKRVDREDRVLVFFAGHGATQQLASGGNLGYLIPVDAELETYQIKGISMSRLRDFSELIPAKHIYYIMDSCYSGIALTRGAGADGRSQSYVQEITRRSARQILTAGGADQTVADSGPGGHSVFTWTLLQGLQGMADMDGNGLVTASELGAFTAPIVSQFSKQTPAFGNLVGSEGGEFIFEMSYESLYEASRELDEEAARLSDELENVRREAREKLARNLALSRRLEEEVGSSLSTEEAKVAQANRHHALGLQYVREKRYGEALGELEEALALNPNNPTIVNNYGFVLYKMGRYRESITWFEKTVSLDENRSVVYVNLGDAYMNLEEEEKAVSCYRKYLALWPSSPRSEELRKLLKSLEK